MSKQKKKTRIITYKNKEIYDILDKIPLFSGIRNHKIGEIIRFKNNALAQIIKKKLSFLKDYKNENEYGKDVTYGKLRQHESYIQELFHLYYYNQSY